MLSLASSSSRMVNKPLGASNTLAALQGLMQPNATVRCCLSVCFPFASRDALNKLVLRVVHRAQVLKRKLAT